MTDAEAVEVLQDLKAAVHDMPERLAAIERAIELLSQEPYPDPKTWRPGMRVQHPNGSRLTISHRKEDDSGWWLTDGSGLSDRAAHGVPWVAVDG